MGARSRPRRAVWPVRARSRASASRPVRRRRSPTHEVLEAGRAAVGGGVGEAVVELPAAERAGRTGRRARARGTGWSSFSASMKRRARRVVAGRHRPAAVEGGAEHRQRCRARPPPPRRPRRSGASRTGSPGRSTSKAATPIAAARARPTAAGTSSTSSGGQRHGQVAALREPGARPSDDDRQRPAPHGPGVPLGLADQQREGGGHEERPARAAPPPSGPTSKRSSVGEVRRRGPAPATPVKADSGVPGQEEVEAPRQVQQRRPATRAAQRRRRASGRCRGRGRRATEPRARATAMPGTIDHDGGQDRGDHGGEQADGQHELARWCGAARPGRRRPRRRRTGRRRLARASSPTRVGAAA